MENNKSATNIVFKIHFTNKEKETAKYTVEEFIKISPAEKVMMTIGENKFEYFDEENKTVRGVKALMFLAKKRRQYLDAIGEKY